MSALVGYGSSDEEDVPNGDEHEISKQPGNPQDDAPKTFVPAVNGSTSTINGSLRSTPHDQDSIEPIQGASLGPMAPPNPTSALSPNTNDRSTLQQLTLPAYPNLSIPPSPPTSPPPGLDQKVSHFLNLKRQGIHFNAKLADSSALKNPSLLPKLMESAGLDGESGRDQYTSTLPKELWDPDGFPLRFYKEGLAKTQQEMAKRKDDERVGMEREFVSRGAERVEVGAGVRGGGAGSKSVAERVMAGLDSKTAKGVERDSKRRKG